MPSLILFKTITLFKLFLRGIFMLEEYINNKISEAYDYMQNDTEKALDIFDDILEIEPDNIEALNGKGSSLIKLNRYDEADKYYNRSLSICENSSALLNKGIILKQKNDFEKALIFYEKASKVNPNLENIVKILKNEIIYADDDRGWGNFSDEANDLIKQAAELKKQDKLWDCLDLFMKSIESDENCRDYVYPKIYEIKLILQREFLYNDGNLNPESKIDRLKIQSLRAINEENNPQKALSLMNLILKLDKNDLNILNHKGGVLFICDEYENAIKCFDKCLCMDDNYSFALFNKAMVLRIMNRLNEALQCFDMLLQMPQNCDKVKEYQSEILDKLYSEK